MTATAMPSLFDLLKQKRQELAQGNRAKLAKIPEGRSRWRVLPSWRPNGDNLFFHDFGAHYIKDETGQMKAVYVCIDATFGRPCDICSAVQAGIANAPNDAMIKLIGEAKAGRRILVNACQIDGDKPTEAQLLPMPPSVFNAFAGLVQEWSVQGINVLDPATGHDVIIERTGTGMNTKYTVQGFPLSTPVGAETLKRLINIDEYVAQESPDQKSRALSHLHQVAGILPAPGAGLSMAALTVDPTVVAAAPVADSTARLRAVEASDVAFVEVPAPAVAPAAPAAPVAVVTEVPVAVEAAPIAPVVAALAVTTDSELDALLNSLK